MVLTTLFPLLPFPLHFDTFQYDLLHNSQMWSIKSRSLEIGIDFWCLAIASGGWKINYIKHQVFQFCQIEWSIRERVNLCYFVIRMIKPAKQNTNMLLSVSFRYLTIITIWLYKNAVHYSCTKTFLHFSMSLDWHCMKQVGAMSFYHGTDLAQKFVSCIAVL